MTSKSTRRARIMKVRAIEHRAASSRLVSADAAAANLLRISDRLGALRKSLVAKHGQTLGLALIASAELSHRLEAAALSLVQPISDADRACARIRGERLVARRHEDGASMLHERAVRVEAQLADERESAARPFRKQITRLGEEA
jgi:hypothetical protein